MNFRTILALSVFVLFPPVAARAAAVYDLTADWSDTSNPSAGGVWAYRAGTVVLPRVTNLLGTGQDAWAPSNVTGNYLPVWYKQTVAGVTGPEVQNGDVVMHSTDSANGPGNGLANALWTDPAGGLSGPATIAGSLWFARNPQQTGRSNLYDVLFTHAGNTLDAANGTVNASNSSRAVPLTFSIPETVVPGDTVELLFTENSVNSLGSEVGMTLSITPEPASLWLLSTVGGALLLRRRRLAPIVAVEV